MGKGLDFDDYFNEGEKKSREDDHVTSRRSTPAPPPPRAAAPPTGITPNASSMDSPGDAASAE